MGQWWHDGGFFIVHFLKKQLIEAALRYKLPDCQWNFVDGSLTFFLILTPHIY